jgi:hypothetical protein
MAIILSPKHDDPCSKLVYDELQRLMQQRAVFRRLHCSLARSSVLEDNDIVATLSEGGDAKRDGSLL